VSASPGAYDALIDTPVGRIGLRLSGDSLVSVELHAEGRETARPRPAARAAAAAILGYFEDPRRPIAFPVMLRGSPHDLRVWAALRAIPCGRVETYGALAARLGSSARAIGGACRRNRLPLLIPCHRVVGADGGLGGFMGATRGAGLALKRALLAHEGYPGAR